MGAIEIILLVFLVLFPFAAALDMMGEKSRKTLVVQLEQKLKNLFSGKKHKED